MVKLTDGEVNIGDEVLVHDKKKNTRRLGKFESLYEGQMNVRMASDNSLSTVPFNVVTVASPEIVSQYFKNRTKQELLVEVERLQKALAEHKVKLTIEEDN